MRKLLLCVLAAIMLVACGKDDFSFNVKEKIKNPYAVTPKEAVQLLQTVIGDETTRSVSISDVQTLTKSNFTQTTRSGADDEVIYIVDIEGGGSAIMGADKRMEPIYAVLDNTKITAEQLVGATTRSESEGEDIGDFVLGLLNNAIQSDIQEVETAGIEMPIIPRDQYWTDTVVVAYQEPLLKTQWGQEEPFNNLYGINPYSGNRFYAGCGPIALAQILYYNRFPSSINNVAIDWDLIEEYEVGNNNPSNSATLEISNFIYQIKLGTGAEPSDPEYSDETGITVQDALDFLRSNGYTDAELEDYSAYMISIMVGERQLLVFTSGFYYDENNNKVGHAWVIDGCNIYRIEEWRRHYITELLYEDNIESYESFNIVHCNFGWDGLFDGNFSSYIFNPGGGPSYNVDLEIIKYSLN